MAKKRNKAEETAVVLPEEVVVADVVNEEESVDVVVAVEENGLLEGESVVEEIQQEEIPVETAECDSADPVDVEGNMEDVGNGAEEELQDSNESLSDNSEDKEVVHTVTPVSFKSDSEEARYHILEFLRDGESHKKSEIVAYITERSGKTFTEATVINVLRGMVNSGSIISLERGSYSIGLGTGITSRLIQFIGVTRSNLEKVATISVSDIHEEDYKAISELKQLKENLNAMYERLASN
ncbi:hypothetical protein [Anaerocolumna sp.]|uniref:hypothetical protein n=1 Tax=Anaerocolumna sp. TaxID=2041569 RepID=UPI0028AA6BFD|nr:hypothetical protein [Anaerocolumna sp.]